MTFFYQSRPDTRGYIRRLHNLWTEHGKFECSEERLAGQARSILKNNLLSDIELAEIRVKSNATPSQAPLPANPASTPIALHTRAQAHRRPDRSRSRRHGTCTIDHPVSDVPPTAIDTAHLPPSTSPSPAQVEAPSVSQTIHQLRLEQEREERTDSSSPNTSAPGHSNHPEEDDIRQKILYLMANPEKIETTALRNTNRRKLRDKAKEINSAAAMIETDTITDTNLLILACAHVTREEVGVAMTKQQQQQKEPYWKRRIRAKIQQDRSDISRLEEMKKGKKLKDKIVNDLKRRHPLLQKKGIKVIQEELKQRVTAKAAKIKRFDSRRKQYTHNKIFRNNQRQFYRNIDSSDNSSTTCHDQQSLNHDDCLQFWKDIWESPVTHNVDADWIKDIKQDLSDVEKQPSINISKPKLVARVKRMSNWTSPGPDGVHNYWLKHLSSLHGRIADQLNVCLHEHNIPHWMTTGNTYLLLKDPAKGTVPSNYRPITCLPGMWKLLSGMIAEDVYHHMSSNNLFAEEQLGCMKKRRGCKEQLLLDKTILRNCSRRQTNLCMSYIDYKKAYDKVPHSWISDSMEMFGVDPNTISFLKAAMAQSKVNLTAGSTTLGTVNIRRGIFQGDSLSPLEFVISMIPLSILLRKQRAGYELEKGGEKINHRLYMDDIKLYAKSEPDMTELVSTTSKFSKDIHMEFGLDKCAFLKIKHGKKSDSNGLNLPDNIRFEDLGEGGYKYLGILESDKILHQQMKTKTRTEYLRRVKKVLKTGLDGNSTTQAINTWAVPVLRYGAGIVNWPVAELRELDRKTRKLLNLHRAHHSQGDVDRLYVSRKKGGRGLMSIEEVVKREENALRTYVESSTDPGILKFRKYMFAEGVLKGQVIDKTLNKHQDEDIRHDTWKNKILHGQYIRQLNEEGLDPVSSWNWLHQQNLKKETEGLIVAAQDQALRTNYVKKMIDKTDVNPTCRLCYKRNETIDHIISGCEKLAQNEYKKRHDKVAAIIHWNMCRNHNFDYNERWYEHRAEKVLENDNIKILWDFHIQTDHVIEHCRPDILILHKKDKTAIIVDIAVPGDPRVLRKERDKVEKYQDLKRELKKLWNLRTITIIPIVIGALGAVSTNIQHHLDSVGCKLKISDLQKAALLGTAHILRKVLDM